MGQTDEQFMRDKLVYLKRDDRRNGTIADQKSCGGVDSLFVGVEVDLFEK